MTETAAPGGRFRGRILDYDANSSTEDVLTGSRPAVPARAASYTQEHPPPRYVEHPISAASSSPGSPVLYDSNSKPSLFNAGQSLPSFSNSGAKSSSLNYYLYTRKGRRGLVSQAKLLSFKVLVPLAFFVLGLIKIFVFPSTLEHNVSGEVAKHAHEAVFLNSWTEHVRTHPVRARDKSGFAEMGLRTEMYAHLLKYPTLPGFDQMERALWPFVPGINQLRRWWVETTRVKDTEENSKGIVMSLGKKGAVFASQFIQIIRERHRNDIPIELYYYGENDLPAKYRNYLTSTYKHVRCIDLEALGLFDADLVQLERQGFAIKPFALLATNFTEVMLADADAILLEDPDNFFQEPGYLDTGTLFFHDRDHNRAGGIEEIIQDFMHNQLSLRGPSPRLEQSAFWRKKGIFEQESGVVVVDKRRIETFAALLFTAWQNMGEIRKKTTYRIWWGDKETFWLAFEFSNFPYYFVPKYAQAIGSIRQREGATEGETTEEFCSEHPLHFLGADPEDRDGDGLNEINTHGRPAWFNGGILDSKPDSDTLYIEPNAFTHEGAWEFLFDTERWCIRNYTRGKLEDFDLVPRIEAIKEVARKAEDNFRAKIPKVTTVKEAVLEDQ
ncbi:hypothetical protein BCV70DRAFT_198393 [Testicularia cyperi]|uniref:Nucleotide-diphospho-sugar transferase n=1 Tax=Testicularia cyperi TaxID=1882483 RepID=A0A317XWA3_9BASI|nr:hypothetical protein BCV70DRAFT_198393 [Testicularia cyperi]